jgi:hypothetical protein
LEGTTGRVEWLLAWVVLLWEEKTICILAALFKAAEAINVTI